MENFMTNIHKYYYAWISKIFLPKALNYIFHKLTNFQVTQHHEALAKWN